MNPTAETSRSQAELRQGRDYPNIERVCSVFGGVVVAEDNGAQGERARQGAPSAGLSIAHIGPREAEGYVRVWQNGGILEVRNGRGAGLAIANGKKSVKRGKIWEFSDESARRLNRFALSLDRGKQPKEEWLFVTHTYPSEWPADGETWKAHLKAWVKRFERNPRYGKRPMLWKLEPQKRGAPHFHILLWMDVTQVVGGLEGLREWASQTWYEVVGSGDPKHLRAGTRIERARTWNGVSSYLAAYLGKKNVVGARVFMDKQTGEVQYVGRHWGTINRALFSRASKDVKLSGNPVEVLMRWLRRSKERRGKDGKKRKMRNLRRRDVTCAFFYVDVNAWTKVIDLLAGAPHPSPQISLAG